MRSPRNVPGRFWVDCDCCFEHGICQTEAPNNFFLDESPSDPTVMGAYVVKQPENAEELQQCLTAMAFCPMEVIHDDGAAELMDAGDPNRKPSVSSWPPPPSPIIESPDDEPVDERERWPIAQIAAGFVVGALSPIVLMIVIEWLLMAMLPSTLLWKLRPAFVSPLILPLQLSMFLRHRKMRPAFVKIYIVTSMLGGLLLIVVLFAISGSG